MKLWAAQDALKSALEARAVNVPVDLGLPVTMQQKHLWITGNADGDPEYEFSGGGPSGERFGLTLCGLVTFAGTYQQCRDELQALWDIGTEAVATLVPTSVSHVEFGHWEVKEGRTAQGQRQLAFFRDVDLYVW